MATSSELNRLTSRELGNIARDLKTPGWHRMRKEELVSVLVKKSRTKMARELIQAKLDEKPALPNKPAVSSNSPKDTVQPKKNAAPIGAVKISTAEKKSSAPESSTPEKKATTTVQKSALRTPDGQNFVRVTSAPPVELPPSLKERRKLALRATPNQQDRLVLMVRDPFWLQAFWVLSEKTLKRAEVALGHFWHTAVPILRLYRIILDGVSAPRRQIFREIRIHGAVNHWYMDVTEPPSKFQIELGYLTTGQKFHALLSSNTVETPQHQVVDAIDHVDAHWRGVEEDLGRIFKLSLGEANNSELKKVFEEQLGRSMSGTMLSQHRASRQGASIDKTQRNFIFQVDVDLVIHGKTEPGVQVSIRNEPIPIKKDGAFLVRFPMPEKRTLFPIEAEGSDGVEMQRLVLTVERNTRLLETLFQEPTDED